MHADLAIEGETLVITGVIDFQTVPDMVDKAQRLGSVRINRIDASGLTQVNSAGVALLLWLKKHLHAPSGGVVIKDAPDQLVKLLSVAELEFLFEPDA